jgi:hypothetical protein
MMKDLLLPNEFTLQSCAGGLLFQYKIEGNLAAAAIACIGKFRLLMSVETLVKIRMRKKHWGERRECIHPSIAGEDENAFAHPLLGKDENAFIHPLLGKTRMHSPTHLTESIHFPLQ